MTISNIATVADFVDAVGREALAAQTSAPQQSISRAITENKLPARWYLGAKRAADQAGIVMPDSLFRMSKPAKAPTQ